MNRRSFLKGLAASTMLAPFARRLPAVFGAAVPPAVPVDDLAGRRFFAGFDLAYETGTTWEVTTQLHRYGKWVKLTDLWVPSLADEALRLAANRLGERAAALLDESWTRRIAFGARLLDPPSYLKLDGVRVEVPRLPRRPVQTAPFDPDLYASEGLP